MTPGSDYYTLMGSLPNLPADYRSVDRMPISGGELKSRLVMLAEREREVLARLLDFLVWERQPAEEKDAGLVNRYAQYRSQITNRFVLDLLDQFMARRTILAGLRCRRLGLEAPPGIAPWSDRIRTNWEKPDFGLAMRFPWINEANDLLIAGRVGELERMHYDLAWNLLKRLADEHHFDFESVVVYLMRWELLNRWTRRDLEVGTEKFEQLVQQTLGSRANLFVSSPQ